MTLQQATTFISFEQKSSAPQLWIDLGAGTGIFTLALAQHLPANSKIIAVDKDAGALKQIPAGAHGVSIETRAADFFTGTLDIKTVDGILMANALHYVKDKQSFLQKLAPWMHANASFLLVEYNRTKANPWVPYPLNMDAAKALFSHAGYKNFRLLNKMPSAYGGEMYAAMMD